MAVALAVEVVGLVAAAVVVAVVVAGISLAAGGKHLSVGSP